MNQILPDQLPTDEALSARIKNVLLEMYEGTGFAPKLAPELEDGLIGIAHTGSRPVAAYSMEKCLSILMARHNCDVCGAQSRLDNIIHAFFGESVPVFIEELII